MSFSTLARLSPPSSLKWGRKSLQNNCRVWFKQRTNRNGSTNLKSKLVMWWAVFERQCGANRRIFSNSLVCIRVSLISVHMYESNSEWFWYRCSEWGEVGGAQGGRASASRRPPRDTAVSAVVSQWYGQTVRAQPGKFFTVATCLIGKPLHTFVHCTYKRLSFVYYYISVSVLWHCCFMSRSKTRRFNNLQMFFFNTVCGMFSVCITKFFEMICFW